VDPGGFEPPTFSMPLRRAPNCAMGPGVLFRTGRFEICHYPVDLRGFEPLTSSVRLRRAPNCATGPIINIPHICGARRRIFYLRHRAMSSKPFMGVPKKEDKQSQSGERSISGRGVLPIVYGYNSRRRVECSWLRIAFSWKSSGTCAPDA
jgi:hypothetical protein